MATTDPATGAVLPDGGAAATDCIRFEGVVKRFGDNVVLRELEFSVAPGERVTLSGPSGSGNTTILRLLRSIAKVNDGVIWVTGRSLSHMRRGDRLVPADEKYLRRI